MIWSFCDINAFEQNLLVNMKVKNANHHEDAWLIVDIARCIIFLDIRLETAVHEQVSSRVEDDNG